MFLIQREVILVRFVNGRFGTAISVVQSADFGFLDVFSSSDASGYYLTLNVLRLNDYFPDDNGKSCVHIRLNNS